MSESPETATIDTSRAVKSSRRSFMLRAGLLLNALALSAFAIPKAVASTTSTTSTTRTIAPPATTPAATPTTTPPPPPPVTDATSVDTADWMCIRVHESGDQYNSPAAPSGAYGILISTWRDFGYSGWPYEAPASVQDQVALELYARFGWAPWSSRFACGL